MAERGEGGEVFVFSGRGKRGRERGQYGELWEQLRGKRKVDFSRGEGRNVGEKLR